MDSNQFKRLALGAARLADDKKGMRIVLLDLRKTQAGLSDYLLVVSGNSQSHLRALQEHIESSLEGIGVRPLHKDGVGSDHWTVLDYGGFLIHLFHERSRETFSLERLWESAKEIAWTNGHSKEKPARAKKPKRARKKKT